jgi:diacylglycerol kinase (ATP)
MNWLAIVNPFADHHTPQQLQDLSKDVVRRLKADCVWTQHPKHASELARQNQAYDGFIAIGGDGTIAEVINGLDHKNHCLAIIPAGTGNGLAHDLGFHDEPSALRALSRPRFEPVDLITVRYRARQTWFERYMISTSAMGYVAGATEIGVAPTKRWGTWFYAITAVVQCFLQKTFKVRLRLDDEPWQELVLTNLVIHNTQHVGQFRLFPEARLHDGRLDVLYGRAPILNQLLEDLGILTQTYMFQHSQRRQAERVEIELDNPCAFMVDGEVLRHVDRVSYQVAPSCLWCCTGKTVTETNPNAVH